MTPRRLSITSLTVTMVLLAALTGFAGSDLPEHTPERSVRSPTSIETRDLIETTARGTDSVNAMATNVSGASSESGTTARKPGGRALPRSLSDIEHAVAWFLEQHEDLKNNYFVGHFGVDSNPAGWDTSAYLRAYVDLYEASHDVRILRSLNELLTIVADGNDILTGRIDDRTGRVLPGWGTREYDYGPSGGERYSDMLTNALFAYPLAAFVRIVNEDPELKQEFGQDAERYSQMVYDLYEVHAPFIDDEDSPYSDGTTGMYAAYPDNYYEDRMDYSGIEEPINCTVIIAEPLVELYRSSVAEGRPDSTYGDLVTKVGNYLWWNMTFNISHDDDTFLTWYYWPADIDPESSTRMEDLTHGARVAEFVVSLYDAGLRQQWEERRIHYLANTFTSGSVIDDTTFANYIDGSGGVYRDDAATLYEWLELEPYSHESSRNSIAFYLQNAMSHEGDDEKYNIAVFAKFIRFVGSVDR